MYKQDTELFKDETEIKNKHTFIGFIFFIFGFPHFLKSGVAKGSIGEQDRVFWSRHSSPPGRSKQALICRSSMRDVRSRLFCRTWTCSIQSYSKHGSSDGHEISIQ